MGTLDDYLKTSSRANAPSSKERRAVFARSYATAVQLTELREKRGLTQKELSALTGIAQSEISRIERGAIDPRDTTLWRLADALDAEIRLVEKQPAQEKVESRRRPVRKASAAV